MICSFISLVFHTLETKLVCEVVQCVSNNSVIHSYTSFQFFDKLRFKMHAQMGIYIY